MAEIHVERKPKRTGLWVALALIVVAVAAGWYFLMGPGTAYLGGAGDDAGGAMTAPAPAAPGG